MNIKCTAKEPLIHLEIPSFLDPSKNSLYKKDWNTVALIRWMWGQESQVKQILDTHHIIVNTGRKVQFTHDMEILHCIYGLNRKITSTRSLCLCLLSARLLYLDSLGKMLIVSMHTKASVWRVFPRLRDTELFGAGLVGAEQWGQWGGQRRQGDCVCPGSACRVWGLLIPELLSADLQTFIFMSSPNVH